LENRKIDANTAPARATSRANGAAGSARRVAKTAHDAAASHQSLAAVLTWMPIALVLVALYFANLFRIYRGKVDVSAGDGH